MGPQTWTDLDLDTIAINAIRVLAAEAVQAANSGHPGMPMGAAPMAYTLWTRHLRVSPQHPHWPDRDRFVLSAGHASMLLYSLLYLTGFDVAVEDLRQFRQWGSSTPGHPEYGETPGVETTTGPLGQGFGNAVGMAIAEAKLAAEFTRGQHTPVDHYTYVMASDGDMMEGVQSEAASLAGHLGLGKLVVLYDDNQVTIDGPTDLAFSEDVPARFRGYGWHTQVVENGNDIEAIDAAIAAARATSDRPSLIAVQTRIGFGSPAKENTSSAHGEPLGVDELAATKVNLGWPEAEPFAVPSEALAHFRTAVDRGTVLEASWQAGITAYRDEHPKLAAELARRLDGSLPEGWGQDLPVFGPQDGPLATRAASGKVLNALADRLPELIGGSADLSPSNKTVIESSPDFSRAHRNASNLRFGVREHAMGAVMNGIALHGGLRAYGGTFLIFHDYMRPSVRLAALMGLPTVYVYTHDSIALGEDGPTHQPIEQLASLRVVPNLVMIRPADANETREAWRAAIAEPGPVALALTRQKLPVLEGVADAAALASGGYVLLDTAESLQIILLASGSEVHLVLEAARRLAGDGIGARVVSLPSWELFDRQDTGYRESVLPAAVRCRLAVEAGTKFGWERYVGERGEVLGIDRFGASAPGGENLQRFGFSVDNVEARARALVNG